MSKGERKVGRGGERGEGVGRGGMGERRRGGRGGRGNKRGEERGMSTEGNTGAARWPGACWPGTGRRARGVRARVRGGERHAARARVCARAARCDKDSALKRKGEGDGGGIERD